MTIWEARRTSTQLLIAPREGVTAVCTLVAADLRQQGAPASTYTDLYDGGCIGPCCDVGFSR